MIFQSKNRRKKNIKQPYNHSRRRTVQSDEESTAHLVLLVNKKKRQDRHQETASFIRLSRFRPTIICQAQTRQFMNNRREFLTATEAKCLCAYPCRPLFCTRSRSFHLNVVFELSSELGYENTWLRYQSESSRAITCSSMWNTYYYSFTRTAFHTIIFSAATSSSPSSFLLHQVSLYLPVVQL